MKKILLSLAIACLIIACDEKHENNETARTIEKKYDLSADTTVTVGEMKRYWLVLLKKGPNRNQDSISAEKIQAGHMANINRLAKEGKLVMAGPMGIDGDLRGIFLMNCKDSAEVAEFVNTDTAVMTGRLIMEYYPWWTMKGKYVFK
jgi:uncharacterized protein YciI